MMPAPSPTFHVAGTPREQRWLAPGITRQSPTFEMKRSLLTMLWLLAMAYLHVAEASGADWFPHGWHVDNSIYKGPPGSFAVFGPLAARTSDAAVTERLERVKVRYKEVSRAILPAPSGGTVLKVVFQVPVEGFSYLSPHYFIRGSDGKFYCIKSIPSPKRYEANAREMEGIVLKIEPNDPPK